MNLTQELQVLKNFSKPFSSTNYFQLINQIVTKIVFEATLSGFHLIELSKNQQTMSSSSFALSFVRDANENREEKMVACFSPPGFHAANFSYDFLSFFRFSHDGLSQRGTTPTLKNEPNCKKVIFILRNRLKPRLLAVCFSLEISAGILRGNNLA